MAETKVVDLPVDADEQIISDKRAELKQYLEERGVVKFLIRGKDEKSDELFNRVKDTVESTPMWRIIRIPNIDILESDEEKVRLFGTDPDVYGAVIDINNNTDPNNHQVKYFEATLVVRPKLQFTAEEEDNQNGL